MLYYLQYLDPTGTWRDHGMCFVLHSDARKALISAATANPDKRYQIVGRTW